MKQYFNQTKVELNSQYFSYCPNCGNIMKNMDCISCNYHQYLNPSPGVAVLIIKNGSILIGKRKNGNEKWSLPCGFIEYNENYLNAAHREVLEETGLKIQINSICNIVSNIISSSLQTLVVVLTASIVSGNEQASDDFIELKWISTLSNDIIFAFESDLFIIKKFFSQSLYSFPIDKRFKLSES